MNSGSNTISLKEIDFLNAEISIQNKKIKYYSSPLLCKNKFKNGFFTKSSFKISPQLLSQYVSRDNYNCILKQIHSNKIIFGSNMQNAGKSQADGMVSDKFNQNLWIYTADCMPILFADKSKRFVAAVHCGRKGLEKGIIKNLIKIFDKMGSSKADLLVALGPSISKRNYLVNKKFFEAFHRKIDNKRLISLTRKNENILNLKDLVLSKKHKLIQLDLKKNAYLQILSENIPCDNIEISNLCTYESDNEFYSWRKNKTTLRQWNFICP